MIDAPAKEDLLIDRRQDFRHEFTMNADGSPINLTGAVVGYHVDPRGTGGTVVWSVASGHVTVNGSAGRVLLLIRKDDIPALGFKFATYYFSITHGVDNTDVYFAGDIRVI